MKFINLNTSEVVNISGLKKSGEFIVSGEQGGRPEGPRFCAKWAHIITERHNEAGEQYFTVNDGWQLVATGERKSRQPKAKKDEPKQQPAPATEPAEAAKVEEPQPNEEAVHVPENVHTDNESTKDEQALITALKNLRGNNIDEAAIRKIFAEEFSKLSEPQQKAVKNAAKVTAKEEGEVYCEKFERIVAKVARGNNVYLYGRAGSGKSHTAEQVAERLGLDFYGQTTIQFAHDVRGYGDAGGNFQETPFFKAFANGGLYFQDEYDRSNSEAAIVLNSALANGWYDFPIVGRVQAHPQFRFMAAGNTLMKGADEEYVTGQIIDASSRDRFGFFFEVDYSHEVELKIAGGDEEIVAFVEDIREAIKATGIQQVVSYRATAAMRDEVENENDKEACIVESVCKGLERDEIREIYGALKNKENLWAKAMKKAL